VSIVSIFIVFIGGSTLGESPFNVIQLLWINMVMDTLAALALATEPPHPTELKKLRVKKHDRIMTPVMWRTIFSQALYQALVMLTLLYFAPLMYNINYDYVNTDFIFTETYKNQTMTKIVDNITVSYNVTVIDTTTDPGHSHPQGAPTERMMHYTLLFATFMMMTIFNQINCRKLGFDEFNVFAGFFNNFYFLFILLAEIAFTWFMVEFPLTGIIFRTTPLPWTMVITAFSFGIGTLLVAPLVKLTPERWLLHIKLQLQEDPVDNSDDLISRVHQKVTSQFKKSETERLLDSQ